MKFTPEERKQIYLDAIQRIKDDKNTLGCIAIIDAIAERHRYSMGEERMLKQFRKFAVQQPANRPAIGWWDIGDTQARISALLTASENCDCNG